jgi:hypothetical protein
LDSSNAFPEKTAMMVQVLHTGTALNTMFHIAVRSLITSIAICVTLALGQLDVFLGYDAGVQRNGQQVKDVYENKNQDVDVSEE